MLKIMNCKLYRLLGLAISIQNQRPPKLTPLKLADQIPSIYSQKMNGVDDFGILLSRVKVLIG